MDRLYRSRMEYVTGPRDEGCFLCRALDAAEDASQLILRRGAEAFVVLNKYPYNIGHVMVAPNRHVAEIDELSSSEHSEALSLIIFSVGILRGALEAHGFNIGANLGEAAGAGVPGHYHWHVVPRWRGDTNFMPVTANSKVMPETLEDSYRRLAEAFRA